MVHEQTNSKNIFDKTIPFELDALCAALYFNWTLFFYVHSLLTVPAISKIPYFWLLCRAFWLFSYGCLSDGPQLVTISCVVVSSVKHSCLCFTRYVTLSAIVASCYRSYLAQANNTDCFSLLHCCVFLLRIRSCHHCAPVLRPHIINMSPPAANGGRLRCCRLPPI